ncbi:hypothetical protein AQUCO_00500375v1 [Aquilegia coerulea]|uniref:Uncharacterized protein n=1 Tax=Aquilegia coerulea TaxID=218851 RepID=A0A2G5ERN4_AQUCA|nr:hypothetical protein AQUCO_00500375v1 [Aquilegia coerulea]
MLEPMQNHINCIKWGINTNRGIDILMWYLMMISLNLVMVLTFTFHPSAQCVLVGPKDHSSTTTEIIVTSFIQARATYFYCPKLNNWKKVLMPEIFEYFHSNCVVAVEQVLFIAADHNLYAYDLVNGPESRYYRQSR